MTEQSGLPSNAAAKDELFASLYADLRRIAHRELRRNASMTLGATTLLHEAYLNMQQRQGIAFSERAAFLAYASRAMRGLIIDYARNRRALKRGAGFEITSLPTEISNPEREADAGSLQRLSDALERLSAVDPRLAQVVDLKYFGGFSFAEIAAMWEVSARTVQRDWEKARQFLERELSEPDLP